MVLIAMSMLMSLVAISMHPANKGSLLEKVFLPCFEFLFGTETMCPVASLA